MELYYEPVSSEHLKVQRAKARELRKTLWWRQQMGRGLCYHCGQRFLKDELTMDHLIPLARGGVSTKNNVVPSCKPCNTQKGNLTRAELAMRGEL